MYHLTLKIILAFIVLLTSTSVYSYKKLDRAVAIVEEDVILDSELQRQISRLKIQQPSVEITEAVRKQLLDQLVLEQLQLRIGKRVDLSVSNDEVEDALNHLKERVRAQQPPLSFESYLDSQGVTEPQLKESIRKEIMIQKIQEGNINRRIRITEREIDDFLESKAGQEWLTIRFRLGHILLPITDNDDTSAIRQAQSIIRKLREEQADFAQLAAEYSKGPNASKGGDLGWREKLKLPTLFVEQANPLKPGEISQPFRSNAGIHILKMIQRSGAEPVMVKRHKVRHILIKPSVLFTEEEAREKINNIHQELMEGEDFTKMAKQHTEDTGSKFNGGDLGWSTPGQFVPEFEKMMNSTPKGAMSKPFLSQFGWHILKVDDIKTEDMFERVKRNQVIGILRKRRFQDELQLWLQEIKEDAYVEILI
jgi:peptidyl-prolyl cis-trans isomerase SurA